MAVVKRPSLWQGVKVEKRLTHHINVSGLTNLSCRGIHAYEDVSLGPP